MFMIIVYIVAIQYQRDKDWDKLNAEQINASRTVQVIKLLVGCGISILSYILQQLKSHMKTLDEIREEVQESDRREFDKRVAGIRKKVYDSIESFGMMPGVDYEEGLWDIM